MKRKNKKGLSFCMTIVLLMSLFYGITGITVLEAKAAEEEFVINNPRMENGVSTWDCIYFGSYWQNDTNGDGVADEKDDKEPIKWRVLSTGVDEAFLLAENGLDCKQYNETFEDATWESCTLRRWLNETFLNTAFSSSEQKAITTTYVIDDNVPYLDARYGENTNDKIFLLSTPEIMSWNYGFWTSVTLSETRTCKPTNYAKQKGAYSQTFSSSNPITWNLGNGGWWLRTSGCLGGCAAAIMSDGYANTARSTDKLVLGVYGVNRSNVAIRPAMNISLSSADWQRAGKVSACMRECEGTCGATPTEIEETPKPSVRPQLKSDSSLMFTEEGCLTGLNQKKNTVSEIREQFAADDVVIRNISGKELGAEELVGTGSTVYVMDGDTVKASCPVVLAGDVNGDGKVIGKDVSLLARSVVKKITLSDVQKAAGDVWADGKIIGKDVSLLARSLVGKSTISSQG